MGLTVGFAIAAFLLVVMLLVAMLLFVKAKLSPSGKITIDINDGEKVIEVDGGATLLSTLSNNGIFFAICLRWRWNLCSMCLSC